MTSHLTTFRRTPAIAVVVISLLSLACGNRQTVAEKSAEAFRQAQAKGTPIAGGHDHDHGAHGDAGGEAAAVSAADHQGHRTAADAHAGMDHVAAGHEPARHAAAHDAAQHGGHAHTTMTSHAAHDSATGRSDAHAGHRAMTAQSGAHAGHGAATPQSGAHAAHGAAAAQRGAHAGHRAATRQRDAHAGHRAAAAESGAHAGHAATTGTHAQHTQAQSGTDPHAGHRQQSATPHAQHGTAPAAQPQQHDAHAGHRQQEAIDHSAMGHGAHRAAAEPVTLEVPTSSAEIAEIEPPSTLRVDSFDAPAPVSVAEAQKAAAGMSHEGHTTQTPPGADVENPPTPRHHDHSDPAGEEPRAMYVCPMHPEVTSNAPGNCPKCGMALVPMNGTNEGQE